MLILSRKERQAIKIGDGITLVVVAVRGKQVRFGIEAPPGVRIRREELAPLPVPIPGNGSASQLAAQ
jgi:carbon storage regulator